MRNNELYLEQNFTERPDIPAFVSFICGLVSVCMICGMVWLGIVCGIVAIVLGIKSKSENGKKCTMAKAGVVLGGIRIVGNLFAFVVALIYLPDFFALSGQ